MGIIKRILLLLFGFLSGLFGFLSLVVAVAIIVLELSGNKNMEKMDSATKIYMIGFLIIICELFLAFGIAASLLALRWFRPEELDNRNNQLFLEKGD